MNSRSELVAFIIQRLEQLAKDKGLPPPAMSENSSLLNGSIDSLDLAALVVELQQMTSRDPFKDGIVTFDSVDELAGLYAS
jgi:acyl carrier protein